MLRQFDHVELFEQVEKRALKLVRRSLPLNHRRSHQSGRLVESRQSVSWAGQEFGDLERRVHKVEDLRHEQQQQRLAEVAEDRDDGKDHACKIAVCVSNKHPSWEPVMPQQSRGHTKKW